MADTKKKITIPMIINQLLDTIAGWPAWFFYMIVIIAMEIGTLLNLIRGYFQNVDDYASWATAQIMILMIAYVVRFGAKRGYGICKVNTPPMAEALPFDKPGPDK